jgi:hypothetical protein
MVVVMQMCKQTMVGARAAYVINARVKRKGNHNSAYHSPQELPAFHHSAC